MAKLRVAGSTMKWYDPSAPVGAQIRKVKQTPAPAIGVFVPDSVMTPTKVMTRGARGSGVGCVGRQDSEQATDDAKASESHRTFVISLETPERRQLHKLWHRCGGVGGSMLRAFYGRGRRFR